MSNENGACTVAPLQNVNLCARAMERATNRAGHLPGMVAFTGPSGLGKSVAAAFVANLHRAYYIQAQSSWTRKALCEAMLKEMGIEPAKTVYGMTDQIAEQLALSLRPLIVDEMDHVVDKNAVETIRDIYEGSQAAILLIGEEQLPRKLSRWERFHGRVLDWVLAQPASWDDAGHLRRLYCEDLDVADCLLERILDVSRGSVRRICVNLARVAEEAGTEGWQEVDLARWGERPLFTGAAPLRKLKV